jgi:hypothetical protein
MADTFHVLNAAFLIISDKNLIQTKNIVANPYFCGSKFLLWHQQQISAAA